MKFQPGQQLYVNNKWFFDVLESKDEQLLCRIKYKEAPNREYFLYKTIKIDENLLLIEESNEIYITCKIDEKMLKNLYGSLIDRIIKESNPYKYKMNEDGSDASNTAGMGSVSQPGLSGIPGVPGTAGSGDINVGKNKQLMYTIPQKNSKLKKALMDILGMKEDLSNQTPETDTDYLKGVYEFLDYPWTIDTELNIIKEANKNRNNFTNVSPIRVSEYFKDLYNFNKSLINNNCSPEFINKFLLIAKV